MSEVVDTRDKKSVTKPNNAKNISSESSSGSKQTAFNCEESETMSEVVDTRDTKSVTKPNNAKNISESSSGSKQTALNCDGVELVSMQNSVERLANGASSISNGTTGDNAERNLTCASKLMEVKNRVKLFVDQINDPDHPYSWICLALFDVLESGLAVQSLHEMYQAGHDEGALSAEFNALRISFIINIVGFIPLIIGFFNVVSKSGSIHKKKSRAYILYFLYHIQEMVSDSIRIAAGISYYYRYVQFEDASKLTMYSTLFAILGVIYFWKTLMEVAIERLELHPYNVPKKLYSELNMFKHCCVCLLTFSLIVFTISYALLTYDDCSDIVTADSVMNMYDEVHNRNPADSCACPCTSRQCYSRGSCKQDELQRIECEIPLATGDSNVHYNDCGSVYAAFSYNDSKTLGGFFHVASNQIKKNGRPVAEVYEFDRIPEMWHRSCILCSPNSSEISMERSKEKYPHPWFERSGICLAAHNSTPSIFGIEVNEVNSTLDYAGKKFHGFKNKKYCGLVLNHPRFVVQSSGDTSVLPMILAFVLCFLLCLSCRVTLFMGRCVCCIREENPYYPKKENSHHQNDADQSQNTENSHYQNDVYQIQAFSNRRCSIRHLIKYITVVVPNGSVGKTIIAENILIQVPQDAREGQLLTIAVPIMTVQPSSRPNRVEL
eukprot:g13869.t1